MNSLVGKVAWITGAGSGIGQAVATALAGAGCTVVLTGRRKEALEQTAENIASNGGTSFAQAGDLTQPETAGAIVAEIEARFGRLDILVNNAGGNIVERAWKDLTTDSIDGLINSNLSAAFYCDLAALALFIVTQPASVCLNEVVISARLNKFYER
jgi:NADP-dependent 3-hydroxy acid dehydrogenase YdfG